VSGFTVAIVGSPGVAPEMGKKGTQSDLTLYNVTRDGHHTTVVEPTQFPEKFPPLLSALAMADRAVLVLYELSRPVAEAIATVDLTDVPTEVLAADAVGDDSLRTVFRGSRLAEAPVLRMGLPELRERIETWRVPETSGPVQVPIDHSFPVKGVGAVALGVVRRGTLHSHDALRLWPEGKTVEIRSIQVHDVDVKQAVTGERVGVALKGVDSDELTRGQILAPPEGLRAGSELLARDVRQCKYYKTDWGEGSKLHLSLGLQNVPAVIGPKTEGGFRVQTDRPVVYSEGQAGFILDLSATAGPRIVARVNLG